MPDITPVVVSTLQLEEALRVVRDLAQDAFWASVAAAFPQITTGDLAPETASTFEDACDHAISHWLRANGPRCDIDAVRVGVEAASATLGRQIVADTEFGLAQLAAERAGTPQAASPDPPTVQSADEELSPDPTHWTYAIGGDVVDAAVRVANADAHGALATLDPALADAVRLVCGTVADDEAEPVCP